jgi:hypothetical protein
MITVAIEVIIVAVHRMIETQVGMVSLVMNVAEQLDRVVDLVIIIIVIGAVVVMVAAAVVVVVVVGKSVS